MKNPKQINKTQKHHNPERSFKEESLEEKTRENSQELIAFQDMQHGFLSKCEFWLCLKWKINWDRSGKPGAVAAEAP